MSRRTKTKKLNPKLQEWVEARARHHLSHAQVQMARELGMNPRKLGSKDNHRQEPWKMPLPQFIEHLYRKRFGRDQPDNVMSIEARARLEEEKKARRREEKKRRREAETEEQENSRHHENVPEHEGV